MTSEITVYSVIWRYLGNDFVIDVDDEQHANSLARHIAETRERTNVRIIVTSLDIDDQVLAKVSERIAARLRQMLDTKQFERGMHGNH